MNTDQPNFHESLIIDGPPWEKRETAGFFLTLVLTIRMFIQRPAEVFALMRRRGQIAGPLQYSVFMQIISFVLSLLITGLFTGRIQVLPPEMLDMLGEGYNWNQIILISMPLAVIIQQFASAFFMHLALGMLGHGLYPYSTVFRIIAYANGTASVWMLLPGVGGLIYMAFGVYLLVNGFRTIYGLTTGRFIGVFILANLLGIFGLFLISFLSAITFAP